MILRATTAVAVLVALGCGSAQTPQIVRRVGGERRVGYFVSPYSYEHFIRGELALANDDLEAAAEHFELARAGPEEDPLVLSRLVDVLDRLDRHDEANEVLAAGLELFPDSESLWLVRGRIMERRGRIPAAIASYERAEMSAPASELGPIALASLLAEHEAAGRADAVLERFIRRAPERSPEALRARLRLALLRGDAQTASRAVQDLMRVAPARSEEVVEAARLALEREEPGVAVALLESLPPRLVDPRLRVRALITAGQLERAEAVLAAAPADALDGPATEARLYLEAGQPERAEEIAEMVLATEPQPAAWLASGLAKLALGTHAEAAQALARIPPGARGYAESRVALADALRAQALDALAAEVLASALQTGEVDVTLRVREALARARLAHGDVTGAIAAIQPARGEQGAAARARILEAAGEQDAASEVWAQIQSDAGGLSPRSRARARAERLLARGERDAALEVLREWLERAPADTTTRRRLDALGGVDSSLSPAAGSLQQ